MRSTCRRYSRWNASRSPAAAACTSSVSWSAAAEAGGIERSVAGQAAIILPAWMPPRAPGFASSRMHRSATMRSSSGRGRLARHGVGTQCTGHALLFRTQGRGQAWGEAVQILANGHELSLPAGSVHREQLGQRGSIQLQAVELEFAGGGQGADRRFGAARLAIHARDHPLQHAQVLAEARPQELAVLALAEPVDVEDLRQLRAGPVERQPMCEVVAVVIAAE